MKRRMVGVSLYLEVAEEIQELSGDIDKLLHKTKKRLETMKQETEEHSESQGATPTEIRLWTNMHGTLTTKFVETMQKYNDIQTEYDARLKARMAREVKIGIVHIP